jgi:hypothetical protein
VTVVQRFGSALNLNVHLHSIVLDGVHAEGADGRVRFCVLKAPSARERLMLTETIARRVRRLLASRGLLAEDEPVEIAEPPSALELCQAASVRSVAALGERAGRPLRKIVLPLLSGPDAPATHEGRAVAGFDLDVGPVVGAQDRARLERLCRYALRPALSTERLEELPDGRLKYGLRHRWRAGTVAVVMEPLELMERLAALVPSPRRHLLRYHGTLAPSSKWRRLIVPRAPQPARAACSETVGRESRGEERAARRARLSWAELMLRVFAKDVLKCPRCGGRLSIIATVTSPSAVAAILECLGLSARPPPTMPARAREQGDLGFEG